MDASSPDPTANPQTANPTDLASLFGLGSGPNFINPAYATPAQKAQMYAYAQELMKPRPIRNGWQGLASMADALVGGLAFNRANSEEQASQARNKTDQANTTGLAVAPGTSTDLPAGAAPSASPASPAPGPSPPNGGDVSATSPNDVMSYTAQAAASRGIDPGVATKVLLGENSGRVTPVGDDGSSFGPLQLHYGNISNKYPHPGLGDAFTAATGLDARDPKTWPKQIDFALDQAKSQGWAPWATTRDKLGIGNMTGIGAPPQGGTAPYKVASLGPVGAPRPSPSPTPGGPPGAVGPVAHAADGTPVYVNNQGHAIDPRTGQPTPNAPAAASAPPPQSAPTVGPTAAAGAPAHVQFVGDFSGLAGAPAQASAAIPPPAIPPPHTMAGQLMAGPGAPPQQPAQPIVPPSQPQPPQSGRLPVSAGAIGELLGNANIDPETKRMAIELLAPKIYQSATGQVLPVFQNQPAGPSIANLGVRGPDIGGVAPSFIGGSPNAPTSSIAAPSIAGSGATPPQGGQPGAGGIGAAVLGPDSPAGSIIRQQQVNTAQAGVTAAQSAANQDRFQKTNDTGAALTAASYPLRQIQAILEKNGGMIPTGEGSDRVQGAASLVNMIATTLGHPLTTDDSRLTSMELIHKYGVQIAQAQASALTGDPTNLQTENAAATSPGTSLSQPSDLHLTDNLIRLNELAQKKNQFEHDYFTAQQKKGVPLDHVYDNFNQDWRKEIDGPNAIPLSKYGREVTLKNGKKGMWVPSTDSSGFSLFPADDPAFTSSVMTPEAK